MGKDRQGADQAPTERRLTVSDAAEELGISAEAVRSRVKRGTLRSIKAGGTVYVLLAGDRLRPGDDQTATGQGRIEDRTPPGYDRTNPRLEAREDLVESLLDQVAYMRAQLAEEREARRRADTIIAQLSQANAEQARTIRALEAPHEPRDAPETTAGEPDRVEPRPATGGAQEGTERSSWLRRWFGG